MTSYPASFVDESGVTRLGGSLDFTNPDDQPGGLPPLSELLQAFNVSVANGANALASLTAQGGDTLLNLTVPTRPTIITAGVYIISVWYAANGVTAGGSIAGTFDFDPDNVDQQFRMTSPSSDAGNGGNLSMCVSVAYKFAAGVPWTFRMQNNDGVSARNLGLDTVTVSRIS